MEKTAPDPAGVCTTRKAKGEVQGQPLVLTVEVTSYEPNGRSGFKTTSGPIHAKQTFAFEPVEGGTRVAMVLELADPQMAAPARQQWDNDLLILKKLLETQVE